MSAAEDAARIVEACVVRPGDVLVLSLDRRVDRQTFDSIVAGIKEALPETVRTVVVDGSIHLHVMRTSEVGQ